MATNVKPGRGTRAGENPAVRVIFYRLCRLLTLPIIPVFVFDGPDRPKVKRGNSEESMSLAGQGSHTGFPLRSRSSLKCLVFSGIRYFTSHDSRLDFLFKHLISLGSRRS